MDTGNKTEAQAPQKKDTSEDKQMLEEELELKKEEEPKEGLENEQEKEEAQISEEKVKIKGDFPVVGIGASAGGLNAFEAFFSGIPKDVNPDVAFVIIQHLDPKHKSILSSLIGRYTSLPVYEIETGWRLNLILFT